MTRLKRFVQKHPVIAYFLLAYAITWISWTPISYVYDRGLLEMTPLLYALYAAGGFGPLLAAAIVTALTGGSLRAWFGQVLRWRFPVKWWLAALGIPFVLYTLMAGIHLLVGGQLNWSEMASPWSVMGGFLTVFLWGGGNEELGWRGFALPHLQRKYGALVSSLIIGVVWTLWHAPPGIIEMGWAGWALDLPTYTVTVTGISLVATWLYNGSGGSVLLTMVFHAAVNVVQSFYPIEGMFTPTGEYVRAAAWVLLVLILVTTQRGLSGGRNERRMVTAVAER